MGEITIIDYQPRFKNDWKEINEAWIRKSYVMEPIDHEHCSHPDESIIAPGGHILLAMEEGRVVGTAGILKDDDSTFELIKMAVIDSHQGCGIGKALCMAAIEKAKEMGAKLFYLYSNTRGSAKAIELYRKLSFEEVPMGPVEWTRADIKMEMRF